MQIQEIEAFLAVVRLGSLTDASNYLHITQPTLSHRIQMLEEELGPLLLRGKGLRRVELTDIGSRFVPVAEKWMRLKDETLQLAADPIRDRLRVSATLTLSTYVMPEVYSRFLSRGLPVDLYLFSTHFAESYEAVASGTMDAVFVSRTISSSKVSAIPVAHEKMVLLCGKNCGYKSPVHPSELPVSKCAYGLWSMEYKLWHEFWFGSPSYHVTVDNFRLSETILCSSDMWAIVPISAAKAAVKTHSNLSYYDLLEAPPDRTIYLLTLEPRHKYINELVEDLVAMLDPED